MPGCNKARPNADPIKGAVQGEATITASTPVKKEPDKSVRSEEKLPIAASLEPRFISEINITPIAMNRYMSKDTIIGD